MEKTDIVIADIGVNKASDIAPKVPKTISTLIVHLINKWLND